MINCISTSLYTKQTVYTRVLNNNSVADFDAVFSAQDCLTQCNNVNDMVNQFNTMCLKTLGEIAPMKLKSRRPSNPKPWINDNIRKIKRECT